MEHLLQGLYDVDATDRDRYNGRLTLNVDVDGADFEVSVTGDFSSALVRSIVSQVQLLNAQTSLFQFVLVAVCALHDNRISSSQRGHAHLCLAVKFRRTPLTVSSRISSACRCFIQVRFR